MALAWQERAFSPASEARRGLRLAAWLIWLSFTRILIGFGLIWLSVTRILAGFGFGLAAVGFGLISAFLLGFCLDFGLISVGFGLASGWISA